MKIFCKEESVKPQAGEMAKTGLRVQGDWWNPKKE
jgi:hypothetical protein